MPDAVWNLWGPAEPFASDAALQAYLDSEVRAELNSSIVVVKDETAGADGEMRFVCASKHGGIHPAHHPPRRVAHLPLARRRRHGTRRLADFGILPPWMAVHITEQVSTIRTRRCANSPQLTLAAIFVKLHLFFIRGAMPLNGERG